MPILASHSNTPFRNKSGAAASASSISVTNTHLGASISAHFVGDTVVAGDISAPDDAGAAVIGDREGAMMMTPVRKKLGLHSVGASANANTSNSAAVPKSHSIEDVEIDVIEEGEDEDDDDEDDYDDFDEDGLDIDDDDYDLDDDDDDLDDESDATDSVFGEMDADDHSINLEINEREIERLGAILGQGARGPEGAKIAKLFVSADRFAQMTSTTIQSDKEMVRHMSRMALRQHDNFTQKPWTGRSDGGINSRTHHGRGDEIYYIGIIDILQQYNIRKRSETFFKGFTEDVSLISSIPPVPYAHRFIQFLRENSD